MKLRLLALAALATLSLSANAALTTYAPWDAAYPNTAGVQFNVVSNSLGTNTIAMGAHAYKNGVTLPNDGSSVYTAALGDYQGDSTRANWSFDYAWDLSACTGCTVHLFVDTDPSAGVNLKELGLVAPGASNYDESWNLKMTFIANPAIFGYNFNEFMASNTEFSLQLFAAGTTPGGDDRALLTSNIFVNALDANAVPEPGTLALFGLGLAGLGGMLRRRKQA